ncbi:hypothetical protein HCA61_02905 [Rhodococcus sp. HNM0563]|nr:hypothetical protein [Rhodococcus sp. HNM0563]NLU61211.1 hypothetical protein [Rhodococcus sp. HNM0563]
MSRFAYTRPCAFAAVLSLTALVTGCGDSPDGTPAVTAASATEVTVPVSAVTATVLDAGAEPREIVRLTPATGTEQSVILTTRSEVHQQIGDQAAQDFSTPELTTPLSATVTESVTEGAPGTVVDLILGNVSTPDPHLETSLTEVQGSGAGLTMGPNGAVSALRLEPGTAVPNVARSALEQAFYQAVYRMVAFPDEAIGVGAVWESHQQVMSAGITIDQVGTATLVSRDDDRIRVDVRVEQIPQESTWMLPNGQGQLSVEEYTMAGSGTMTIDPNKPLPVQGDFTVSGDQTYLDPNGETRLSQSQVDRVGWHTPESWAGTNN